MSVPERTAVADRPRPADTQEQSSRLSLHDLDRLLAGIGDGGFAVEAGGVIRLWNAAAHRILGYAAEEAIGKRCDHLLGIPGVGRRGPRAGGSLPRDPGAGEPAQACEVAAVTKMGERVWLSVTVVPASASGSLALHLFHDITQLRALADRVRYGGRQPVGPDDSGPLLTPREREVLRLLVAGASSRTAAERLHVSLATVRNHVQSILRKLDVHSRLEAVAYANRHRLI